MKNYLKHQILLTALLLMFIGVHTVQACSMNAAGKCGGSACPTGESCVAVSEFKCDCQADKNQLDESLENHMSNDAEPEMFLSDPGRPGVKRFLVDATGLGDVRCGNCSTSKGCNAFWIPFNVNTTCIATAAAGHQFEHWTINGNFAGNKSPLRVGGKPGTKIVGQFVPEPDSDGAGALGTEHWSLPKDDPQVRNRSRFEASVINYADSASAVNVVINGNVFDRLSPGDSSNVLDVPVGSNGEAILRIELVSGGTAANGTTRHTAY